jgi:hypothetical protein
VARSISGSKRKKKEKPWVRVGMMENDLPCTKRWKYGILPAKTKIVFLNL